MPLADDLRVESPDPARIADRADVALLSLPNGLASGLVPNLLERGVRVVDLSADYRYRSLAQWSNVYAQEARLCHREDAALCSEAVYGLPEWNAPEIAMARLVAAPGCFPTASLLPLLPFLKQGLIEQDGVIIDAKTGTSGGGRAAKEHLLLAEASESITPYGVWAIAIHRKSNRWQVKSLGVQFNCNSPLISCQWCVVCSQPFMRDCAIQVSLQKTARPS